MKVALFFAGHARDLEITKEFWQRLIQRYQIDVYGSFWETDDETKNLFLEIFKPKKVEFEDMNCFLPFIEMNKKNIKAPFDLNPEARELSESYRILPQYYRIWRAAMLTNQEKYDIVIKARTDIIIGDNLVIEENGHLNIPCGLIGVWDWKNNAGPIDLFAYGSQSLINYYSSLFLHLSRYLQNGEYFFPSENLLRVHLSQKDFTINYMDVKVWLSRGLQTHFTNYSSCFCGVIHSTEYLHSPDEKLSFFLENREI